MLTLIFAILMFGVFGKLLWFAIKAAWGITKIVFTLIFLPLVLVGIFLSGLISVALLVLAVVAVITLFLPGK